MHDLCNFGASTMSPRCSPLHEGAMPLSNHKGVSRVRKPGSMQKSMGNKILWIMGSHGIYSNCTIHIAVAQNNVRNPNHHYFSKKYRSTPPICIAIGLQFVLQCFWCPYALRKGIYCQYSSHLYHSTPPICSAIHLPFVSQYFWENLGGCGHRNVPQLQSCKWCIFC